MSVAPVATVVVTTHDRPEFARRAIASALAQRLADVEVVVVDDGSQPPLELAPDTRVRLIRREEPGGMCAARNAGLAAATGTWILFLDDDDELVPESLERSLAAANESGLPPPVVAMGTMAVVGPDGAERERVAPLTLARGSDCFLEGRGPFRAKNALVMPTDLVRGIGGWDDALRYWEADDFGLRLNAVASIQGVDEPLYRMTAHVGPRVSRSWEGIAADMERTRAKHAAAFARHRTEDAEFLTTLAFAHLEAGSWGAAVAWSLRGLARDPRRSRGWILTAACAAGPYALRASRVVRRPGSGTPLAVLTRRRLRKYGTRVLDRVRALAGVPLGRLARVVGHRAAPASTVDLRDVLVIGVYRARNARVVADLVGPVVGAGGDVRLWALDAPAPEVAALTRGSGPGPKFRLLNRLVGPVDAGSAAWIVVIDDDVRFVGAGLADFLAVADRAGLDLAQPAHTERSFRTNPLVLRRPLAIARRTTFVEIGPVFAVRRPAAASVVPFPEEHEMGWGLELEWWDLGRRGARLGIVDAVPVRHLTAAGAAYERAAEQARLDDALRARGLGGLGDAQHTTAVWWPWRSAPPWGAGALR